MVYNVFIFGDEGLIASLIPSYCPFVLGLGNPRDFILKKKHQAKLSLIINSVVVYSML